MKTQTSNALHNAIMEAGGKDRPPMLELGNYVQWKSIIKRYIDTKPNHELIHYCLQNPRYEYKWTKKAVPVAEGNSKKTTERSQQATRNRGKAIVNSFAPIYDQEPVTVTKDDEMSKEKEIDKLMALVSLSFKKIYKPTTTTFALYQIPVELIKITHQESSEALGTGYENQRVIDVARARENVGTQDVPYHKEKMLLYKQEEAGVQLNAEQEDWRDDTDDESNDQELEAHYMYMAQIQEVTPDISVNSGPIFVPNGDALRKCILSGPYKPTTILVQAVAATDDSPAIPERTIVETPVNMSPANKAHFEAEKEAIHLILTRIRDEIYSISEWSRVVMIVKQQHKLDEVSYHKLFDILKQNQKEVNKLRAERLARNANPLALVATAQANQEPYYQTLKSHKSYAPSSKPSILTRPHTTTRYKGKEIAKPITPLSDTASEEDSYPEQAQGDKDMQKNLALIAKKPKRVKDSAYHKEKMLLCKQAEKGVTLQAEQYDWLVDTDEEIDKQELEAHYSYMAKIQEVPTADTGTDSEPLEQVQNDTGYNVFTNDLQHSEQTESINNTCLMETDDNNVILDSPNMCDDDIQNDQNDVESDDKLIPDGEETLALEREGRSKLNKDSEYGHVAKECQKPKRAKDAAYHKEKMLLCKQEEARFQLNAKQADWKDDTDDEPEDQELKAHYMYTAQLQEVTPDAADNSEPIFDTEALQQVQTNDNYNVFAIKSEHPEQSKSIHDTYPIEEDEHNMIIDSLDMSYDREQADQNDDDNDLANEHELLASLIEKLKCEIDDSKNRNKFLETSNKALVGGSFSFNFETV
nr:hypothetical protein [Tanacetum cinerariifolium]